MTRLVPQAKVSTGHDTDWNYEFMASCFPSKAETSEPYMVVFDTVEAIAPNPTNKIDHIAPSYTCPILSGYRLDRGKDGDTWRSLLPKYAKEVQVLKTAKLGGPEQRYLCFPTDSPAEMLKLKTLMDRATSIFTFDAERSYALLRRIQDDRTLAGLDPTEPLSYIRQGTQFFREDEMIPWRFRTTDIRSSLPKSMRLVSLRDLLLQLPDSNPNHLDPRGGVFLTYQAILLHLLDRCSWR